MRSRKQKADSNRSITGHIHTLHQRLYHSLGLGTRFYDENLGKMKWKCSDIEVQKLVLRSIAAFIDSLSADLIHLPLVKDAFADLIGALSWILECKTPTTIPIAANVAKKITGFLPSNVVQSHMLDLVSPLSSLLSFQQVEVKMLCANALKRIIRNLNARSEKVVWEELKEMNCVSLILSNLRDHQGGTMKADYFQELVSLLSIILWHWPASRFAIWNDDKLMRLLATKYAETETDFSIKVSVLTLYSSLALCGIGARKLIESGEEFLQMIVQCMGESHPLVLRIEGFKLMQFLMRNEDCCLRVVAACGEPLIQAIICAMRETESHSKKIGNSHSSLLMEACRLARITRWSGNHHYIFWKDGLGVLLNLLVEDFSSQPYESDFSLEEKITAACQGLSARYLLEVRGYVWDVLGWLAIHCKENFVPTTQENKFQVSMLIICACLAFMEKIHKWSLIYQDYVDDDVESEPVSRAVLMMLYSPCKYITSSARFVFSKILRSACKLDMKSIIHTLNYGSSFESFGLENKIQVVINLVVFICCLSLPQYRTCPTKDKAAKALVALLKRCLIDDINIERLSIAPHLRIMSNERVCCWVSTTDWEGTNILLFYILWGLAELIHYSETLRGDLSLLSSQMDYTKVQFIAKLKEICQKDYSPGVKWYTAYVLSFFHFYGFPSDFGRRIGKLLAGDIFHDVNMIFVNGKVLRAHRVVLAIRCPSLLPSKGFTMEDKGTIDLPKGVSDNGFNMEVSSVHLSAQVDYEAMMKLLEYVYFGYVEVEEELTSKLKTLAKHCGLQPLFQLLCHKHPKWGSSFPFPDLMSATGPVGYCFRDIMLESETEKVAGWSCTTCSYLVPHMHSHKIILQSSCGYVQAIFQSGMQESFSEKIRVPISWEAMVKLVHWIHSNELPKPPSDCLWVNMDKEEKLITLKSYVELLWLADFWLFEDIGEACWTVVTSCLDSARELAFTIIQIAANFSMWKLVEVAANYVAPSFRQLRDSGKLDSLDDELADLIRSRFLRLTQQGV